MSKNKYANMTLFTGHNIVLC